MVTPKKTCGFGATPGFGGDIPLFFGFGGDFFSALMVVTKNHPHVVVTSTNRATFGGDKALSAVKMFKNGGDMCSFGGDMCGFGGEYPRNGGDKSSFGGE